MTDADGPEIVDSYRKHFNKKYSRTNHVIVAVNVICAETSEKANEIAKSSFLWKIQQDKQLEQHTVPTVEAAKNYPFTNNDLEKIHEMKQKMIIGNPNEVKERLVALTKLYGADELMIVTRSEEHTSELQSRGQLVC